MKTAKITAVHQTAHHQYGSQGETVYNVTLDNGWTGWIVGFGADHYPTIDNDLIRTFTDHAAPDDECGMVGCAVEIRWETKTATISALPVGRGHYKWTVQLDFADYGPVLTFTDPDSRAYDAITGAEQGDPEAVDAKLRKIDEVIEANGITCYAVRHSVHPYYGDTFEADIEE